MLVVPKRANSKNASEYEAFRRRSPDIDTIAERRMLPADKLFNQYRHGLNAIAVGLLTSGSRDWIGVG